MIDGIIDSNCNSEEAVQNTKDTHGKWTVSWPNNRSEGRRFYGDQSNKCWTLQHLHPLVTIIVTRPHFGFKLWSVIAIAAVMLRLRKSF